MIQKWIVGVMMCGLCCGSAGGQVVAAWDFGADSPTTSNWTEFVLGPNSFNTVDGLTLTQAAAGSFSLKNMVPHRTHEYDPALLTANADEMNDGFDLAGMQAFTLSGLADGTEYRFQFIGVVTHTSSNNGKKRNLTMTLDDAGASSAILFNVPVETTATTNDAGYSAYLTFTADASGDVVITFGEDGAGNKCVAGLIVEELQEVEPPEPVEPPVITSLGVGEGGTNLVMSWTSEAGQAFDLFDSDDLDYWKNLAEDIPASASASQSTYSVALDPADNKQFYKVRTTDGRPPNMILLFADDLGYGDLACYGHPYAKTPNLDKLAEQGTLFREFNVTGMTCNPSRTGILSSWHPNSYALNTADYGFDQAQYGYEDHPTVMELLNDAGYKTGHFGKWHIGPVETNGTYGIDEIIVKGGGGLDPRGRDEEIYQDAIDFIVANQHTNFYMNVMGRVTHAPVNPRPELVTNANFHTLEIDRAEFPGQQIQDIFDGIEANSHLAEPGTSINITNSMRNYLTEVYYLDKFIGELLDKLDELGLAENTIIAFSSDQGAAVPHYDEDPVPAKEYNLVGWSGGLRGQKHDQHEGGVRSPFILRWPGYVPAGKINTDSVTSALDWLPTLCGIAGVDISGVTIQGEDVLDIWKGADRSRVEPQFWNNSMKKDNWRAYFQNASSTNMVELFDLATDLSETNNLVSVRPDIVAELTPIWMDWQASLP